MRSSTAVFLALGGIGSFAAGFWFARFPSSTTTHETSSPLAQHTRATSTATAQPVRCEIPLPAHPRDWRHLLTIIDPEEVPEVIDAALAIRDTDLRARVLFSSARNLGHRRPAGGLQLDLATKTPDLVRRPWILPRLGGTKSHRRRCPYRRHT